MFVDVDSSLPLSTSCSRQVNGNSWHFFSILQPSQEQDKRSVSPKGLALKVTQGCCASTSTPRHIMKIWMRKNTTFLPENPQGHWINQNAINNKRSLVHIYKGYVPFNSKKIQSPDCRVEFKNLKQLLRSKGQIPHGEPRNPADICFNASRLPLC